MPDVVAKLKVLTTRAKARNVMLELIKLQLVIINELIIAITEINEKQQQQSVNAQIATPKELTDQVNLLVEELKDHKDYINAYGEFGKLITKLSVKVPPEAAIQNRDALEDAKNKLQDKANDTVDLVDADEKNGIIQPLVGGFKHSKRNSRKYMMKRVYSKPRTLRRKRRNIKSKRSRRSK